MLGGTDNVVWWRNQFHESKVESSLKENFPLRGISDAESAAMRTFLERS